MDSAISSGEEPAGLVNLFERKRAATGRASLEVLRY
jgi:hypothetical protein